MLSTPSKNGSPKNADSGSSNAAHSTIPPRLVLPAAAFSNSSSNALRLFGATSGKNGSSIGCSHMHGSNRKSDMFPIRRTCEKTRIPCSRRSCFAIAPAKMGRTCSGTAVIRGFCIRIAENGGQRHSRKSAAEKTRKNFKRIRFTPRGAFDALPRTPP